MKTNDSMHKPIKWPVLSSPTPGALPDKHGVEWATQTRDRLRWALDHMALGKAEADRIISELREHGGWERILGKDGKPYAPAVARGVWDNRRELGVFSVLEYQIDRELTMNYFDPADAVLWTRRDDSDRDYSTGEVDWFAHPIVRRNKRYVFVDPHSAAPGCSTSAAGWRPGDKTERLERVQLEWNGRDCGPCRGSAGCAEYFTTAKKNEMESAAT